MNLANASAIFSLCLRLGDSVLEGLCSLRNRRRVAFVLAIELVSLCARVTRAFHAVVSLAARATRNICRSEYRAFHRVRDRIRRPLCGVGDDHDITISASNACKALTSASRKPISKWLGSSSKRRLADNDSARANLFFASRHGATGASVSHLKNQSSIKSRNCCSVA